MLSGVLAALILGIGGYRVIDGFLTMGMLVAFQQLMNSFVEPVNHLTDLGRQVPEGGGRYVQARRCSAPSDGAAIFAGTGSVAVGRQDAERLVGSVELRSVTFGYSRLEPPLIKNFSLVLKPGERVAIVGASGSGKSTVARLVSGLYEPWEGEILFDGKPRNAIPREVVANSLAVVDQDVFLFEGSTRDNLTLWDSTIGEPELIQAAKDACIHDDLALRGGYDQAIEESGRNFSGGQRQRMEIARALAFNPRILLLDEATAALDVKTEQLVDDAIRRRGCTAIIVAHRLSTIRDCDEIIVLERGNVVERGVHDDLLRADGYYARLIQSV